MPVAALARESLSATFLICIGLASPSVLVWRGDRIPGIVDESTQQQSFDIAAKLLKALGLKSGHCVLLEKEMGVSRARAVIHYGAELPVVDGAQPLAIEAVMHLPVGELAVAALAQVIRMVTSVQVNTNEADGWQSGRV